MIKAATRAGLAALTISAALLAGCNSTDSDAATPGTAASSAPATNGIADLEAAAILDKAKAALKSAKSFHIKGAVTEESDKIEIDLKNAGADFAGSMAFSGAKLELLSIGGHKYMRPDATFWNTIDSTGATAKLMEQAVGTKWIKLADKDDSFSQFFGAADIDDMLSTDGKLSKGEAKTVDGVPAFGLIDESDTKSTLYIATTGEAYPVKLEGPNGEGLSFTEYGATFPEIKEPAATEFVDQSALTKK